MGPRFTKAPHLGWRRMRAEMVLLDVRDRRMIAINEDGAKLVESMEAPRSVDELMALCRPGARSDEAVGTRAFLEELESAGLLLREEEEGTVEPSEGAPTDGAAPSAALGAPWNPKVLWEESLETGVQLFMAYSFLEC